MLVFLSPWYWIGSSVRQFRYRNRYQEGKNGIGTSLLWFKKTHFQN